MDLSVPTYLQTLLELAVAKEKRDTETPRPYRPPSFEAPDERALAQGPACGAPKESPLSSERYRPVFRASVPPISQAASVRPFQWTELKQRPPEEIRKPAPDESADPLEDRAENPPPEEIAQALLHQARGEAEAIVARASREADGIREQARKEGFESGHAEGRKRAEQAAQSVETVAADLARYKSSLYQEARQQVVELALAVVNKILGPLGESDERAVVVRVVERALQFLSDREHLTIRVNPGDLKDIVEAKPRILEIFDGIERLTVVEDPSVKRGGCVLQTPTTEIDARLDTQLQEVVRSVRSA